MDPNEYRLIHVPRTALLKSPQNQHPSWYLRQRLPPHRTLPLHLGTVPLSRLQRSHHSVGLDVEGIASEKQRTLECNGKSAVKGGGKVYTLMNARMTAEVTFPIKTLRGTVSGIAYADRSEEDKVTLVVRPVGK